MRGEEQDEVLLFFAVTFLSLEEGGINSQAQKKEEGAELETEMEMEMEMGEGPYLLENAMPGPVTRLVLLAFLGPSPSTHSLSLTLPPLSSSLKGVPSTSPSGKGLQNTGRPCTPPLAYLLI